MACTEYTDSGLTSYITEFGIKAFFLSFTDSSDAWSNKKIKWCSKMIV